MARSRSKVWWLSGALMAAAGVLALAGAAVSGEYVVWLPLACLWFALASALLGWFSPRRLDPPPTARL